MKRLLVLAVLLLGGAADAQPISSSMYCKIFGRFHVARCPTGFWLFKGGLNGYVPGSGTAISMTNTAAGGVAVAVAAARASNETCQDASNRFVVVSSGKPCVTLAGLRTEPSITNLILWSQDSSHWTLSGVTAANNATGAPDGTATVNTITASAGLAEHKAQFAPTVSITRAYSFSLYAQPGTVGFVSLWDAANSANYCEFNLTTGTVQATGGTGFTCQALTYAMPSGWTRYSAAIGSFASTTPTLNVTMGDNAADAVPGTSWTAAGTETVNAWGVQLESAGACGSAGVACPASGYVPTTGSTASRSSDDYKVAWPASYGFTDFSVRADMTFAAPSPYYITGTTDVTWLSVTSTGGAIGCMAMFGNSSSPLGLNAGGRYQDNTLYGPVDNSVLSNLNSGDVMSYRASYAKVGNLMHIAPYLNGAPYGFCAGFANCTDAAHGASTGLSNETEFHIGWDAHSIRGAVGGVALMNVCLDNSLTGCLK